MKCQILYRCMDRPICMMTDFHISVGCMMATLVIINDVSSEKIGKIDQKRSGSILVFSECYLPHGVRGGGCTLYVMHIRRDPIFIPKFCVPMHIIFSKGKNLLLQSITIFSCKADFSFLPFWRPSFSKFLSVQAVVSYISSPPAASQMSLHGQHMHIIHNI